MMNSWVFFRLVRWVFLLFKCDDHHTIMSPLQKRQSKTENTHFKKFSLRYGEWPSGLRRYPENRKDPGSNPARRSAGLWDPTSLRDSRWPSGRIKNQKAVINIGLVRLPRLTNLKKYNWKCIVIFTFVLDTSVHSHEINMVKNKTHLFLFIIFYTDFMQCFKAKTFLYLKSLLNLHLHVLLWNSN